MYSAQVKHREVFDAAFADPRHTSSIHPDQNVNEIIRERYSTDGTLALTKTQLWDMKVQKARNPAKYLRPLIRPGSLKVFNVTHEGNIEFFTRVTVQRTWPRPNEFTTVIEQIRVDPDKQEVLFIGIPAATGPDGEKYVSGVDQPLFHVEHAAKGTEDEPIDTWRIVLLTDGNDEQLLQNVNMPTLDPHLRLYSEIFIRETLGKALERKGE
ncbi:hypothetical protein CC79DRAFT_1367990 [Sarocladium strictum]